jgi:hypothetical protein
MKIKDLFEAEEKSLVGMEINGKTLPVEGKWEGNFECIIKGLTSLEGAPSSVGGDFWCQLNDLTSLKGAPSSVGGIFNCSNNQLTSLEGAPSSVGGIFFSCSHNQLTSLEGTPSSVGSNFYCYDNQLTSLKDIHRQIKKIGGKFYCDDNPIKSHVLGLLLIDGLTEVVGDNDQPWVPILNQTIKQFDDKRKRVMWAQAELVKQLGEEGKALAQL